MFAVKGWNVDATLLKPQTEPFQSAVNAQNDGKPSSRKRKRDRSEPSETEDRDAARSNIEQQSADKRVKKLSKSSSEVENHRGALPAIEASQDKAGHNKNKNKKNKSIREKPQDKTLPLSQSAAPDAVIRSTKAVTNTPKLTPMQAAMRQKLVSARFRHLNETLYTAPSQEAQQLFNANPDMFEDYHSGFRQQVSVWPENPVDKMIQKIRLRGSVRLQSQKRAFKSKPNKADDNEAAPYPPLPRTQGTCIIADCGCGDARLAQTLKSSNELQKLNVKVHSYDLYSPSPLVTKADISALPLADGTVDVTIFCLALMGTNWISFIEEAYRVLHWKGELWVAEIKSRFARVGKQGRVVEHSVGNRRNRAALQKEYEVKRKEQDDTIQDEILQTEVDGVEKATQETDVHAFVEVLKRRGFVLKDEQNSIDLGNKMFVSMEFVKAAAPAKGKGFVEPPSTGKKFIKREQEISTEDEGKTLKPCLYKIR
ncbi:hypothetical protein AMS68_006459 [Peltaster fructicola]|uniref:Ribosomal RNA-processing protein 8 n=1 Tax=Peltaster fructicola TaxID=286661 RepID=A0A6H0Y1N5_9PEZI|nr:hypothetical protein AMS68_006459 [Peltaster fructicola]